MGKYLRPTIYDVDPASHADYSPQWQHWKKTFQNFLDALVTTEDASVTEEIKLKLLENHLSPTVYAHVKDCTTYDAAITRLDSFYVKPANEVYSRHKLSKRQQQAGESIDQYLQALKLLAKECQFKDVKAEQNENEYVRDAFISGLASTTIRQRLLENAALSLDGAHRQARSLEIAQLHNESYQQQGPSFVNATTSMLPAIAR